MIYTRSNLPMAYSSPFTHNDATWGSPVRIDLPTVATVAAATALTTQQNYTLQTWPFFWLYDITISCATTGTGGEHGIEVYNTQAAGTAANSYLLNPASLPLSVAGVTLFSTLNPNANQRAAQTTNGYASAYPFNIYRHIDQGRSLPNMQWASAMQIVQGAIFSLRVKTPATTGTITDLRVSLHGLVSDVSFGEYR